MNSLSSRSELAQGSLDGYSDKINSDVCLVVEFPKINCHFSIANSLKFRACI
jgi:hypothetical protein